MRHALRACDVSRGSAGSKFELFGIMTTIMEIQNRRIRFVDGFKIRDLLEDDFGIVEIHSSQMTIEKPKFWIPENEIWIDYPYRDESEFLVEMNDFTFPTETETYEMRREMAKKKFCTLPNDGSHIIKTEEKTKKKDGLKIQYVDGKKIRRIFDPEFTLGGHDLVYDYIPLNEIWLDHKMDEKEIPYILFHEKVERKLMVEGKPYHIAHEFAIVADKEMRRKDGVGHYAGDPNYSWKGKTNEEFRLQFYVE